MSELGTFVSHEELAEQCRDRFALPAFGSAVKVYTKAGVTLDVPRTGQLIDLVIVRGELEAVVLTLGDGRRAVLRWSSLAGISEAPIPHSVRPPVPARSSEQT